MNKRAQMWIGILSVVLVVTAVLVVPLAHIEVDHSNAEIHRIAEESRREQWVCVDIKGHHGWCHGELNVFLEPAYIIDKTDTTEIHCLSGCVIVVPRLTNRQLVEVRVQ